MPTPLPIPRVYNGQYSPNGNFFAYQQINLSDDEWRNYHGDQANPIWVMNMNDHSITKLPWDGSNDLDRVWIGKTIDSLTDRDYTMNIYGYNTDTEELNQVTQYSDFDVKTLNAGGGVLVHENAGYIHRYDPETRDFGKIPVQVDGDFPWSCPHWEEVGNQITNADLSPSGVRALVQGRVKSLPFPPKRVITAT